MKNFTIALCVLVSHPVYAAAPMGQTEQIAMVEAFLKTPTENLPPEHINTFLAVDPAVLPKKLRDKFKAKRLELYTLKQIADGKKRGSVRTPDADCLPPSETKESAIPILQLAGFEEIREDDEDYVLKKTHCLERQLVCEFSLHIIEPPPKSKRHRRLLLHVRDPLFSLVGEYRAGATGGQTNFFGALMPVCSPPAK